MEEETYFDVVLKYGLFVAGIFQLVCLIALIFVPTAYLKKMEKEREENAPTSTTASLKNSDTGKPKKSVEKIRKRR